MSWFLKYIPFIAKYVEERETLYQPCILMAIADENGGKLGPPFKGERRAGDRLIVENALFNWSEGLGGFALKGFRRVFELNGFGEYERAKLGGLWAGRRALAARRLGTMICIKAAPELLPLLRDRSGKVRRAASWALAKLGQSEEAGVAVTSARPEKTGDAAAVFAAVSGRFLWEDGSPLDIGSGGETEMYAAVRNEPIVIPGGRVLEGGPWRTYTTEYLLPRVDPKRPAVLKAVLEQPLGGYDAVFHRQRENISVRAGCATKDVDFVFPRLRGTDDRVSVDGRLKYPAGARERLGGGCRTIVALTWERPMFYSGFHANGAAEEYRLHDVPPGRYRIKAEVGPFAYEGSVEVTVNQPLKLDLPLPQREAPGP